MRQILRLFHFLTVLLLRVTLARTELSCSNVKFAYTTKGFDGVVPKDAISGKKETICDRFS